MKNPSGMIDSWITGIGITTTIYYMVRKLIKIMFNTEQSHKGNPCGFYCVLNTKEDIKCEDLK